jgi:very-short-patch-repair endonuclease
VIEADGGQHCDNDDDARRTAWLEKRGWRVIRFWNNDILANPAGVYEAILRALGELPLSRRCASGPSLSRKR